VTVKPSLRVQWILSLSVAAILVTALVVIVDHGNHAANQPAPPISRAAVTEENREARILVTQDQAPHVAPLPHGVGTASAVAATVQTLIAGEIRRSEIVGPIERSGCRPARGSSPGRLVYGCTVEAASVNYPFDAVVVPAARQITYCKRDQPPVPSMNIPVSTRCT
jgi:hypothetical protein